MSEITDNNSPVIDKKYCDENDIRSDWYKSDKYLASLLLGIVEEGTDKDGNWCLIDAASLGYVTYAITVYFLYGSLPPELEIAMNKKERKLQKLAIVHAIEAIEESRVRIAENRLKGRKGGLAKSKNRGKDDS